VRTALRGVESVPVCGVRGGEGARARCAGGQLRRRSGKASRHGAGPHGAAGALDHRFVCGAPHACRGAGEIDDGHSTEKGFGRAASIGRAGPWARTDRPRQSGTAPSGWACARSLFSAAWAPWRVSRACRPGLCTTCPSLALPTILALCCADRAPSHTQKLGLPGTGQPTEIALSSRACRRYSRRCIEAISVCLVVHLHPTPPWSAGRARGDFSSLTRRAPAPRMTMARRHHGAPPIRDALPGRAPGGARMDSVIVLMEGV